jgi:trehalose 6-phosphate phosphatase
MKSLTASFKLDEFFTRLKKAEKRALLLDYDGTLAPFTPKREEAVPYPGLRKKLNQLLEADHTRIVIISGRSVDSLLPLLQLGGMPEVWGTHGLERLQRDGTYRVEQLDEDALDGLKEAQRWIESEGLTGYCEHKVAGIAVHTRGLDKSLADEICLRILKGLSHLVTGRGLVLQQFDGGVELRVRGIDKGVAVTTVLDELGPNSVAAYLGDDLTDEDAFRAIKGRGLAVLVRSVFRPTTADLWLKPPEELMDFLQRWRQVLGGEACQDNQNGN